MSDDNDSGPGLKIDRDVSDLSDRVSRIEGFIKCATWVIPIIVGVAIAAVPFVVDQISSIIGDILDDHSIVADNILEAIEEKIKQ